MCLPCGCWKLVKESLAVIVTTTLLVIGVLLLSLGLGVEAYLAEDYDLHWMVPLLVSAGVFVLIGAAVGCTNLVLCCGKSAICLLVGVVSILVAITLQLSFLGAANKKATTYGDYLSSNLTAYVRKMDKYPADKGVQTQWDTLQLVGECCGLRSVDDWKAKKVPIPDTCCKSYTYAQWLADNKGLTAQLTERVRGVDKATSQGRNEMFNLAGKVANGLGRREVKMATVEGNVTSLKCDKTNKDALRTDGCFETIERYFKTAVKVCTVCLAVLLILQIIATGVYVIFLLQKLGHNIVG